MRLATLRIFRPAFPAIARALIPTTLALCVVGVASAADAKPTGPAATAEAPAAAAACPALLRHEFPRLQDDAPQNLCQYAGKVLLVVLGFPSNQFGSQEPGSSKEIADFCFNTYGVKFPMFAKTDVRGDQANAFYKELARATGTTPKWNFYKYVVDRKGQPVEAFSSMTTPNDGKLVKLLDKLLASPR
jgi:glutathione peroxidase